MGSRTQIVCLHEGQRGRSLDPIFINALIKKLAPPWIRPFKGSNIIRPVDCGGRSTLIDRMPAELKACLSAGGNTTLMVWADLDHDMSDGEQLKSVFWSKARDAGITEQQFDLVVFVFAKDRLENWIEFLLTGTTDELVEGARVAKNGLAKSAVKAARVLAQKCDDRTSDASHPPSLRWSFSNWQKLVARMQAT